ncbi:MAG TPA: PQQ-dependent sugar dehydrogenase [Thermoanaerobaculia bacterium]|nr:PQQ-dependent sugar dehydrogenase [Thermoanaerobaculia bacterium]
MSPSLKAVLALGAALFAGAACALAQPAKPALELDQVKLPPGFSIEVWTDQVPGARSLTPGPDGVIFVGTQQKGSVYAVVDRDGDRKVDAVHTVASGLNVPNGVAFKDGALYVAEINRILRYDDIAAKLAKPPQPAVVVGDLPTEKQHGWKFIAFGPDGKLYVPVGAPCNICEIKDPFASILRMNADGSGREVFARGVRNTVGFDWDPKTNELWFTDNGRDFLGDDAPPDELNRAPEAELFFGYPFCHGDGIQDPQFGKAEKCAEMTKPAAKLGAHVAAIGMRFYTGEQFPADYRGQILIAEHGSWNRSSPVGYRVMRVTVEDGKATSYQPLAEGWLQDRKPWGRPVDVELLGDGSLLVSDDIQGSIYRIKYQS